VACVASAAGLTSGQRDELTKALDVLSSQNDTASANTMGKALLDTDISLDDWSDFFKTFFDDHAFTTAQASFWDYAIGQAGDSGERIATISGLASTAALRKALSQPKTSSGQAHGSAWNAAVWLQKLATELPGQNRQQLFSAFNAALQGECNGVVPSSGMQRVQNMDNMRVGIQLCLTAAEFTARNEDGRTAVAAAMGLQDPGRTFWIRSGAFLLDNNYLNKAQVRSLGSLAEAVPSSLHSVVAVAVSQGLSLDPSAGGFHTSAQIISIQPIAMGVATDPAEWLQGLPRPVAPLFTIRAAQQYVRAIQQVQFHKRPALGLRLAGIIQSAGAERAGYLLSNSIPSGRYVHSPAALMPDTAYLWFIDTENTFRQAMELFNVPIKEPVDEFLLFADMMTGGGGSSVLFHTDPRGIVTFQKAAVGRVALEGIQPPGIVAPIIPSAIAGTQYYLNAIQLRPRSVRFKLDSLGHAAELIGP